MGNATSPLRETRAARIKERPQPQYNDNQFKNNNNANMPSIQKSTQPEAKAAAAESVLTVFLLLLPYTPLALLL